MIKNYTIIFFAIFINSCSYPEMVRNELIYDNNFETKNLDNIAGGGFTIFNNSTVLGNFNNDEFYINLNDVGEHNYIFVSFDLYIHGTWDGNNNGFEFNDRADKWILEFNPPNNLYSDPENDIFETTFSNSPCFSNYCLKQSYPESFPNVNNPKTGSFFNELKNICSDDFFGTGPTTLYKIEKGFKSSGNAISLKFADKLYQPNAIDKDGVIMAKCDESWSIDNLKIRIIKYE